MRKCSLFYLFGIWLGFEMVSAQNLVISNSGETGTSGTNWSITGNSLLVTGTATVKAEVIEAALALGNLIIEGNTTDLSVTINEAISVSSGGNQMQIGAGTNTGAITISQAVTSNGDLKIYGSNIFINGNISTHGDFYVRSVSFINQGSSFSTTTNGGDIIYWAGGSGESYIRPGTLVTNGGHVYMGGDFDAVGTLTWHGHTVGGGYAFSTSFAGVALRGDIDTRLTINQSLGGDVYIAGESGQSALGDVAAESTNRTIASGNGNITLLPFSEMLQSNGTLLMNLQTTGKISIAPVSGKSFWSGQTRTYNGSMSGTTFNGSSALAGIQIPNFANIGGWELGTWSGTGVPGDSPYVDANIKNMELTTGFTVTGSIDVKGNAVWVRGNLEATANGAHIRVKSDGPGTGNDAGWVSLHADLTTNGGDIILWSNAANRTSGLANNEIWFIDNRTLTSNGGKIVLAGGLDDGSNGGVAGDGIPDGYAFRGGNTEAAIRLSKNSRLLSGNGDIIIRGEGGTGSSSTGIHAIDQLLINSGTGTITIDGKSAGALGINFGNDNNNNSQSIAITSASSSASAISIVGTTTANNWAINFANSTGGGNILVQSTATTGGGVNLTGVSNGNLGFHNRLNSGRTQILSLSGDINISTSSSSSSGGAFAHRSQNGFYIGERFDATAINGITPVAGFTGNIILNATGGLNSEDNLYFRTDGGDITLQVNRLDDAFPLTQLVTTGAVVIEPTGDDFTADLTFNSGWSFDAAVSSLRIGKIATSADGTGDRSITLAPAIAISGPIAVYGGNITLQHNLTSTAASADITLVGSGSIFSLTRSKTISTNGGDVLFAADSDGNGSGNIRSAESNFSLTIDTRAIVGGIKSTAETGGGNITLGGGDTAASSYATGTASNNAEGIRIDQGFTARSGGGNITMRGRSWSGAVADGWGAWGVGFWNGALTLDAGEGKIYIEGVGRTQDNVNSFKQGFVTNNTVEIYSANTGSDAVTIKGHQISTSPHWNIGIDLGATTQNGGVGYQKIVTTGVGGGIVLDGLGNEWAAVIRNGTDLVTNGGPISMIGAPGTGGAGGQLRLLNSQNQWWGSRSGQYNDIVAKDLTIRYNSFSFSDGVPKIAVSGDVLWEPFSNSFGQTVNTNWYSWNQNSQTMTGLTIGKATNTADITSGTAITAAGPISFYGGNITVNENLNTSAGNADGDILLKGSGNIIQAASKSFTTNGGDVTLWADSDGNGTGYIQLTGGSNSGITSGGGHVFLGGGTALATGYARGAAVSDVSVSPSYTLYTSGVHLRNGTSINSGGGNITLRGQNVGNSDNFVQAGIMGIGTTLDAGTGKIALYGLAGGSGNANAQGISRAGSGWTIRSSSTASDAIYLEGNATATNNSLTSLAVNFQGTIEATGTGGGVTIIGHSGTATNYGDGVNVFGNVLANSGPIEITGSAPVNNPNQRMVRLSAATLGSKTGTNVTASSSNVIIRGDQLSFSTNNPSAVNTSGTLTLEPLGDDFTNALTFPIPGLSLNATVSGLTIGKEAGADGTTDRDVTLNGATSIAGPITVYGGNILVQQNLSSTGSGSNILLKGSGRVDLSNNRTIATNGGDVTLWADADNEGDGFIRTGTSSGISTTGGNIILGGGADISTGFAKGHSAFDKTTEPIFDLRISGVHLMSGTSLSSGGGSITLRGKNFNASDNVMSFGVMGANTTLDAGAGKVSIVGNAHGSALLNAQAVSHYLNGWTIRSSNTDADAISIEGDATSTINSATSMAINFVGTIEATGNGGGVTIIGNSGSTTGTPIGANISGNVLAASGPINISGSASNNSVSLNGATLGSKTGSNVTASSSDITLTGNQLAFTNASDVNTSGTLTLEPLGNEFSNAINYPIANLSLASIVSGLTIGKPSNTADVTISGITSIAGPITLYGGTLNVAENLTSSNGSTVSLYGNALAIATGKAITSSGGKLIVAPQNTANTIGIAGATGVLQLPAAYFGTNFVPGFSTIQIGRDLQTGDINSNAFTLSDNVLFQTTGALNLGGIPELGNYSATLHQDIAAITQGNPPNYFKTNGTGRVIRTLTDATVFQYPVGNSEYNPLTITNNSGLTDTFAIQVRDAVLDGGNVGSSVVNPRVDRTWGIRKYNPNSGAGIDFEFQWYTAHQVGAISDFFMNYHDGNSWTIPPVGNRTVDTSTTDRKLIISGYQGTFSDFSIGSSGDNPLPIVLTGFSGTCNNMQHNLNWTTASEINNYRFLIERSEDGISFENVGEVAGAGTTAESNSYSFDLPALSRNAYYYRLVQEDFDGTITRYPPLTLGCGDNLACKMRAFIFPNPSSEIANLQLQLDSEQTVILQVNSISGAEILKNEIRLKEGVHLVGLPAAELPSGVYTVNLRSSGGIQTLKWVRK